MGFFDFLSAPAQDPTLEDQELFKQKKNSGSIPTLDDPSKRIESTAQPPKPKAAEAPQAKDPMADRNRLASEIEGLKVQVAKEIAAERIVKTGFSGKMDGSHLERAAIKEISGKGPEEAARGLEAHAQSRGVDLKKLPSFQRLEQAVLAYKRAQREPAVQEYQAQSKVTLAQRDIPRLEQQVKSATDALMKVKAELAEAPSARMEADLKKQEETLAYKMGSLTDQLNAAKNTTQKSETLPTQANQSSPAPGGVQGSMDADPAFYEGMGNAFSQAPVTKYFNDLGIDRGTLLDRLHKSMSAIGIPLGQWDERVDPRAAMMRVVGALDNDGSFAALLAQQLAEAKAQDGAALESQEKNDINQAERQVFDTQNRIGTKEQELRDLYARLSHSPFMSTWPGIILYVLVGMLTQNPAFAAKLIGGMDNPEKVGAEIKGIQFDLRRLEDRLDRQEQYKIQLRREATARLQKERDYKRSKDDSLQKMYLNHKLILERARQNASPQNRAIVSKLEGDFNRTLKFMQDAETIMNNDWLEDRDPKKIRASREYDRLRQEAEFIDQKLRALTEQLVPGTYSSEEDDASGGAP